jgi:outer membrane lipoprotein-sorting protein
MVRTTLAAALVALAAAPLAAQDAEIEALKGSAKLAAVLKQVASAQAEIRTLQADFEQRRVSRLLAEPSVSQGRLYVRVPDEVRWEYLAPRPMTVLIAGGYATTYRPEERRAERVAIGRMQRRIFHYMTVTEPLDELRDHFSFTFYDPVGVKGNYRLILKPTHPLVARRISELAIEIDRREYLPLSFSYSEPDGDSTAYRFRNVVRNGEIADAMFKLELPPGVEVVEVAVRRAE